MLGVRACHVGCGLALHLLQAGVGGRDHTHAILGQTQRCQLCLLDKVHVERHLRAHSGLGQQQVKVSSVKCRV